MIKRITALLILLSIAISINNPFNYEGYYMMTTERYVLELPTVLTDSARMDQRYDFTLLPDVYVNDNKINLLGFLISPSGEGNKFNPADSYLTRITNTLNEMEVTSEVRLLGDYIETKTTVVNKGKSPVSIRLAYNVSSKDNFSLFDPSQYSEQINNYIVAMPIDGEGPSLGIVLPGINLKTENANFQEMNIHKINVENENVEPDNSITVTAIFYPMNIQKEEELYYPIEMSDYSDQKTVRTRGLIAELATIEELDLFIEGKMGNMKSFSHMRIVDLHSAIDNYLTAAIYYEEMCEMGGYICKLFISEDNEEYYAWVEHYERDGWVKSPIYNGIPEYSKVIYQEPISRLVTIKSNIEDKNKAYYQATLFLMDINKSEALLYFALIIIFAIVILAVIQVKAKSIMNRDKKISLTIKVDPNGEYMFLKERKFGDPFIDELIKIIKERKGNVNVREIQEVTKYSPELISFGVEYLSDEGVIRKRGKQMTYTQITETKGPDVFNESKIPISKEANKSNFSKITLPKIKMPKLNKKKEATKEEKTKDLETLKERLKDLKGNQ